MNADQYRTHSSAALRRAFLSGELVGLAGAAGVNPYRRESSTRSPRRASFSESYVRAWALGKEEGERERALIARTQEQRAAAVDEERHR